jgi:hypothetical protein
MHEIPDFAYFVREPRDVSPLSGPSVTLGWKPFGFRSYVDELV